MSTYVNFFLRNEDNFISIGDFCRNSKVYQLFNNIAPYERMKVVSKQELDAIEHSITEQKCSYKNHITRYEENIRLISTFNNTAEEKLDSIADISTNIEEINNELEELTFAQGWVNSLIIIQNSDNYIYVGIEVPCKPTIKDIVE